MTPPLSALAELLSDEDEAIRHQGRALASVLSTDELLRLVHILEHRPGLAIARHLWLRCLTGAAEEPVIIFEENTVG